MGTDDFLVQFAAPRNAHCIECDSLIVAGHRLESVRKTRVRDSPEKPTWFVYAFECRSCGAPCSFTRSAGTASYSLHEGLHESGESISVGKSNEQQQGNENGIVVGERSLAKEMRERAEKRSNAAACALMDGRYAKELRILHADRDMKYADDVTARAVAAAYIAPPTPPRRMAIKTNRTIVRARTRAARVNAALGVDRAAVVRRAARRLRRGGVNLSILNNPVSKKP